MLRHRSHKGEPIYRMHSKGILSRNQATSLHGDGFSSSLHDCTVSVNGCSVYWRAVQWRC
uniref:Uncharacterized protein n=1 Tax=Arundo donax TaxID=35708 RepID=A0A0A9D529_ARUDO